MAHGLDYIERIIKQNSRLDHTKNFYSTRSRYYQKDQTKKTVKIKVMVIRYRGTPPSLAVAKGSAHTQFFFVGEEGGVVDDG